MTSINEFFLGQMTAGYFQLKSKVLISYSVVWYETPTTISNSQREITDFYQEKTEEEEIAELFVSKLENKIINLIIGCNISFWHIDKPYFIKLLKFFGVSTNEIPTSLTIGNAFNEF